MTQEEKQLLLKDLCARLPYLENWVQHADKDYVVTGYGHGRVSLLSNIFSSAVGPCPLIEEIKPYLRPMSSMTEEEYLKYSETRDWRYVDDDHYEYFDTLETFDWLNEHHFDYRGLIPMGLALEAPEGMYKTE